MTNPTDLIARADAALDGVTEGPWACIDEDQGCEWGANYSIVLRENVLRDVAEMVGTEEDARFIASARQLVPALRDALAAALTRADLAECHAEALEAEKEHASLAAWRAAFETAADIAERRINAGRAESVPESLRVQARIGEPEEDCAAPPARATAPASPRTEGDET